MRDSRLGGGLTFDLMRSKTIVSSTPLLILSSPFESSQSLLSDSIALSSWQLCLPRWITADVVDGTVFLRLLARRPWQGESDATLSELCSEEPPSLNNPFLAIILDFFRDCVGSIHYKSIPRLIKNGAGSTNLKPDDYCCLRGFGVKDIRGSCGHLIQYVKSLNPDRMSPNLGGIKEMTVK